MGGFFRSVGRAFENTVSSLAGRRNDRSGGPLNTLVNLAPAAIGIATGNPALTGIGAMMALGHAQAISMPSASPPSVDMPPINIPSFDQLKQNAVIKTQEAFDRQGIYHMLNPFRRFNRDIAPSDRDRFPSLRKTAKERAKKRMRNG